MATGWWDWLKIDYRTHVHLNEGTCQTGQLSQSCLWEMRNNIYAQVICSCEYALNDAKLLCVWWTTIFFFNWHISQLAKMFHAKQNRFHSFSAKISNLTGAVLYLPRVTLMIMNSIAMFKHSLHLKWFCCLSQSTGGTHTLNLIQAAATLVK